MQTKYYLLLLSKHYYNRSRATHRCGPQVKANITNNISTGIYVGAKARRAQSISIYGVPRVGLSAQASPSLPSTGPRTAAKTFNSFGPLHKPLAGIGHIHYHMEISQSKCCNLYYVGEFDLTQILKSISAILICKCIKLLFLQLIV